MYNGISVINKKCDYKSFFYFHDNLTSKMEIHEFFFFSCKSNIKNTVVVVFVVKKMYGIWLDVFIEFQYVFGLFNICVIMIFNV